ncbi:PREDICTED: uncharacterized protein LOC104819947 isoform X1 [Tarenaya hassleriana]|uniref:uncharacterized protein LOC104819947 isoform X1 n=1 Tax=Tarenaya hassleriana TaxID=28532 RepID=UPI00053C702F|nr:PREDICTED: uncharacterized protein LOC104819947 isoform X1 [Tarenaya hassleriana]
MDFENSGFSEAGESGWTTYLDYSSSSIHRFDSFINGGRNLAGDDEYEVDLSMVSDASSGPRFYCEDVEEFLQEDVYCSKNKNKKEHEGQQHRRRFYSCLDDTASSLVYYTRVCVCVYISFKFLITLVFVMSTHLVIINLTCLVCQEHSWAQKRSFEAASGGIFTENVQGESGSERELGFLPSIT